jgi:hypothetical protein
MSNILRRIEAVEEAVAPEDGGIVVFKAGGTEEERNAEFARQKAEYLAAGGNPSSLFVNIIERFSSSNHRRESQ